MLEGSGGVEIERRYRLLADLKTKPLPRLDGALVVREQGEVYQLPVDPGMAGLLSPSALPKGSVLGVKPSVLDDFATAIQENWIYQTVFRAHSQPVTETPAFRNTRGEDVPCHHGCAHEGSGNQGVRS